MGHKYVKENEVFNTSKNGTVPKPTQQEVSDGKYLKSDGSWDVPSGSGDVTDVKVDGTSVVNQQGVAEIAMPSVPSNIEDLSNIEINNPQMYQVLTYNWSTGKWQNVNNIHVYSTSEHIVGIWTDGKPIYEKTVYCNISAGAGATTAHNISSIKQIISIQAVTTKGVSDFRPLPFAYATSSTNSAWYAGITVDTTNVYIEAGSSFGGRHSNAYVTIQYTKSTD